MHGANTAPAAHISCIRLARHVVECWNDQIWSWFATVNVHLCTRRQMTVVYGSCVRMKNPMTQRSSIVRDLSIRVGEIRWGVHGACTICSNPIIPQQLSRNGHYMSMWSNLVVIRYCKWRIRRGCHQVVVMSGSRALIWKADVTRPRTYRDCSIGYATSSGTMLTHTQWVIALYVTNFTSKFTQICTIKYPQISNLTRRWK